MPVTPLTAVNLAALMEISTGNSDIILGLIDGPVLISHPELADANIRSYNGLPGASCLQSGSAACMHGTFMAGMLCARRGAIAPSICPDCTLFTRPIFSEATDHDRLMPSSTPQELAVAIEDCIAGGTQIINMSLGLARPSIGGEQALEEALNHAAKRGVLVVAAAGNQATLGSSAITRHPWVIPVAACDLSGKPISISNLGSSIGRNGLCAPGEEVTSLGGDGKPMRIMGTSAAAPFITGTIALLWSLFPNASASEVKSALLQSSGRRRNSVVPPLLDAYTAYLHLVAHHS